MHDISQLKKQQDKLLAQEQDLIQAVKPFLDGLLNCLEQFTKEAIQSKLRGVKPLKRLTEDDNFLEATLSLDGEDLVIVSNFALLQLDPKPDSPLVSRVFIYSAGETEPGIDIVIQRAGDTDFKYQMRWFGKERVHSLRSWHPLTREEGVQAAESFIDYFYGLTPIWRERPALTNLRKRENKTPLGFHTS